MPRKKPKKRRPTGGLTDEQRAEQIAALPPGTSLAYIYRRPGCGWRVCIRRQKIFYFGGHYVRIADAVLARDRLLEQYPMRGATGRPKGTVKEVLLARYASGEALPPVKKAKTRQKLKIIKPVKP